MQSEFFTLVAAAAIGGMMIAGCSKPADTSSSTETSAASIASAAPATASSAAASTGASSTVASAGDADKGETIFNANCASCHGAKGAGGGVVGPSLKGEKSRKDTGAAIAWIKNPEPPMAKLYPLPLSEKDVADVAAYVESL